MNHIEKTLLDYVKKSISNSEIGIEDDLFESGAIHSLFAIQLILFIEKEFGIEIDDDDLDFEKIKTIKDIASLVDNAMS